MKLLYFRSVSPNPNLGKHTGDNALAKLGDLNVLVDQINNISEDPRLFADIATTANIDLSTTGLTAIDGITPISGVTRVLVKNQSTPKQNGIYTARSTAWTRTSDADTNGELTSGTEVFVLSGTANSHTTWTLTTANPIVIGTTSLTFTKTGVDDSLLVHKAGTETITGAKTFSTTVTLGTDVILVKEVDHNISVATTTTAATVGGSVTVTGGIGATTGNGGAIALTGGTGGATGGSTGGAIALTSGAPGAGGGTSGAVTMVTATGTTATGVITVATGNATTTAGAITIVTGTAATTGGAITLATGNISAGTSGAITEATGTGTTGTGAMTHATGNASAGASGSNVIATGTGTTASGDVTIATGNASTGNAGNINISTGTSASATVGASTIISKALVRKPAATSTAAATLTGPQLLGGLITCTGATGNFQLPTAAQITTAIGATPAGTSFDFCVNAAGMTATNVATLVVGTNMSVSSAPAITGGDSLTVTQDTQVIGWFRITYDSATTCKIQRIS